MKRVTAGNIETAISILKKTNYQGESTENLNLYDALIVNGGITLENAIELVENARTTSNIEPAHQLTQVENHMIYVNVIATLKQSEVTASEDAIEVVVETSPDVMIEETNEAHSISTTEISTETLGYQDLDGVDFYEIYDDDINEKIDWMEPTDERVKFVLRRANDKLAEQILDKARGQLQEFVVDNEDVDLHEQLNKNIKVIIEKLGEKQAAKKAATAKVESNV